MFESMYRNAICANFGLLMQNSELKGFKGIQYYLIQLLYMKDGESEAGERSASLNI